MSPSITLLALAIKLANVNLGPAQVLVDHVSVDYQLHGPNDYRPSLGIVLSSHRSSIGLRQVKLIANKGTVMLVYKEQF